MTILYIEIDRNLKTPLHLQLIWQLKNKILSGELEKGYKLPSSRTLSINIKVSRIVTIAAYEQLIAEGYLFSKIGSGTYVSNNIPDQSDKKLLNYNGPEWLSSSENELKSQKEIKFNFSIGHTASNLLPELSWKRAWKKSINQPILADKPPSSGTLLLRETLAQYLKRSRNIDTNPENIIITSGAGETLRLISSVVKKHNPVIYAESPGYKNAWQWLSGCGDIIPIKIDQKGFKISDLPRFQTRPSLIFLTPSHQFPIGYRLSLKRRNKILEWAERNDSLILEDDYDSEFHYESMALPTLKSQDRTGNVIYFSSFSKSISPDIKIGYMIAPKNICKNISQIIANEHAEPSSVVQNAMAHFIASGDFDKHIARSRRHYTKLNKIMRSYLSILPNDVTISGLESGIHAFISFKKMPAELIARLNKNSFYLPHQISRNGWHGFALGYGHFEEDILRNALDLLTREIHALYPKL